ncbi:hypothetical protein J7E32_18145 [Bacillus sp. ISL-55]|nr:hypothetical protein [Bacillus sp. ISL-55]
MKGNHEKLSEHGPTSDRFEGESSKAVRAWATFRQVWKKSTKSCPNPEQLQTGFIGNHDKLSEHGPTSDRFER